ncbi:hypothetical protein MLD38_038329 [Melastoma candidum]|uniref:Uncharacterized protein n=1 Tax=Melastoma candidum TaxID=119954 RepID=A0ACB9KYL1_9MYRT|nr:hypothetical protein MLD38_038329 [Melastoma candidum]
MDALENGYNVKENVSIEYNTYYANAACNGELSKEDCGKCLMTADDLAIIQCRNSDGVNMKLADCHLRAGSYDFDQNTLTLCSIHRSA